MREGRNDRAIPARCYDDWADPRQDEHTHLPPLCQWRGVSRKYLQAKKNKFKCPVELQPRVAAALGRSTTVGSER